MMLCHTGSRSLVPVGQMQEPVEGNSCALGSAFAMRASPADVGRLSDTVALSLSLSCSLSLSLSQKSRPHLNGCAREHRRIPAGCYLHLECRSLR